MFVASTKFYSPSGFQSHEFTVLNHITESLGDGYSSFAADNLNNDTEPTIELSDHNPSVLWMMQKEKSDKIVVKAEEGYKIAVTIIECALDSKTSYVKVSPSKFISKSKKNIIFSIDFQSTGAKYVEARVTFNQEFKGVYQKYR